VSPRWVGSGWAIFNNKGKPVRQYEPFFSSTHDFEFAVEVGVSPIVFYDPTGRVVATLHPNHTYNKVLFDPWQQTSYDANDTVLLDPKTDSDVSDYFKRLPVEDFSPTWYQQRITESLGTQEEQAAKKAAVHADTPATAHSDSLGNIFLTVTHNKVLYSDTPASVPPTEAFYQARTVTDIEGNPREVIDANDRIVVRRAFNMLGSQVYQSSMEAGERWMLNDVGGKGAYAWNSRGFQFRSAYDQLQRPTESYVRDSAGQEMLAVRTVYGETELNPEQNNFRGRVVRMYDQAGVVTNDGYDFKGNLIGSQRQLAQEYTATLDWTSPAALEKPMYHSSMVLDALNRPVVSTLPDSTVIHITYNEASLPERMEANVRGATAATAFITNINYNAKRQRELIEYGNGATTQYEHDPLTFRLTHVVTKRNPTVFPDDGRDPPPAQWPGSQVQNLRYTYDPVGNTTYIKDEAQQTIYFRNQRVEPSNEYTYDATYQLIEATGREHLGQTNGVSNAPTPPTPFSGDVRHDNPNDGKAMGIYLERFLYDAVGNIQSLKHAGSDPKHPGWTRNYTYNEASQIEPGKKNNRLSSTSIGSVSEQYHYDGSAGLHGNITGMPHLSLMQWDYRDKLQATAEQVVTNGGLPEITWYVYDASGKRIRKVTERQSAAGAAPTRLKERHYLGGVEFYREYSGNGSQVTLEYETVHIMDGAQRIALIETRTQGTDAGPPQLIRYQLANHLGSVVLELDDQAQIVSYEEYTPFGSSAYQAVRSQTELPKRYRFSGMERDKESGFQYHGARYYAPWLGRWTACDPIGTKDGLNLYMYVGNSPIQLHDPSGTEGKKPSKSHPATKAPAAAPAAAKPPQKPANKDYTLANLLTIKGSGEGNATYGSAWARFQYFPGTSNETMIIVGGQHQSEPKGYKLSEQLYNELKTDGPHYYNIVFVPNLYEDRGLPPVYESRLINGIDTNRNLPGPTETLADSFQKGAAKGVPLDSTGKRPINDENVILVSVIEKFKPTRLLQIHDKSEQKLSDIVTQGEAGTYVDPRTGPNANAEQADYVTKIAALRARDAVGERAVKGNFLTDEMVAAHHKANPKEAPAVAGLRAEYPATARHQPGTTLGAFGSHSGGMDVFLVEAAKGQDQATVNRWTGVIKETYLENPTVVVLRSMGEGLGWKDVVKDVNSAIGDFMNAFWRK
jgi:RHS repeat-associated protein